MDAVKFIEERRRMCKATRKYSPIMVEGISPKDIVKEVEEWSAAHPRKTRQDVFLEQFPNIELDRNGIINISPCKVDQKQYPVNGKNYCKFRTCSECRREFWTKVVE